jgi:formylglycine-generating enzyme
MIQLRGARLLGALLSFSIPAFGCHGPAVGTPSDTGFTAEADATTSDVSGDAASDTSADTLAADTVAAGDAGADADASSDGASDGDAADTVADADLGDTDTGIPRDVDGCPVGRGPAMVKITVSGLKERAYCIDTTEVSDGQFRTFLASPGAWDVPSPCSTTPTLPKDYPPVPADKEFPAGNTTWCQAYAYCKWAHKRLCLGLDGGKAKYGGDSEWTYACRNGVAPSKYPYGAEYRDVCNVASTIRDEAGQGPLEPVGTNRDCRGTGKSFEKIFDMVGNASEFVDPTSMYPGEDGYNPDAGPQAWSVGGGAGADPPAEAHCGSGSMSYAPSGFPYKNTAFRCCADAAE